MSGKVKIFPFMKQQLGNQQEVERIENEVNGFLQSTRNVTNVSVGDNAILVFYDEE
jgi:hypothetical protein